MPYKKSEKKVFNRYTPPPETEIILAVLQEFYIDPTAKKEIKDRYFLEMQQYARSILLKEIKRKGLVFPLHTIEELSINATIFLMSQYMKEGWKISASFAGALRWKVIEALYGDANDEMNYSLNRTLGSNDNSKEALDMISVRSSLWYQHEISDPSDIVLNEYNAAVEEVEYLISQAYEILPYRVYMRFLPWLLLKIRKPKVKNIMTQYKKCFLTNKEEEAFEILLMEMRNRILQHVKG